VCVCLCACIRKRERDFMCVCLCFCVCDVCVYVRERERESSFVTLPTLRKVLREVRTTKWISNKKEVIQASDPRACEVHDVSSMGKIVVVVVVMAASIVVQKKNCLFKLKLV
jgi:hypothetical protein